MDHNASSNARLFLAAVPDADTALRIYRLAAALKRAHKFEGKIIEPDRLHISYSCDCSRGDACVGRPHSSAPLK